MAKTAAKLGILDTAGNDDHGLELRINESFAKKYHEKKRNEELKNLKNVDLSDDDDESDSETDDEDGDQLTEELDKDISRTLKLIRKKDPSIYDSSITFFQPEVVDSDSSDDDSTKATSSSTKKKADKPLYYKDLVRQQVLAGDVDGSDESDDDEPATTSYAEDQARLKGEFLQSLAASGVDDDDELDGGIFTKRTKTAAEKEADDNEYKAFKELHGHEIENPDDFLNKYLKSGVWKEGAKATRGRPIEDDQAVDDSEDEEALDKADAFEHAYNFRFEEEGGGQIQTFSRHIDDSLRRKDDKRKIAREERKARKALERLKKEEELRRLKNLKQADIEAKLEKVRALMGDENSKLTAADIDGAFDPAEHDRRMAEVFDDEYYGEDDGEKPTWNDDDEIFGKLPEDPEEVEEADVEEDADDAMGEFDEGDPNERQDEVNAADDDDGEDADEEAMTTMTQAELDAKKKQYLDELYALDYEDLIGDLPCRFKYREVAKNNYGLTTEDILYANDQELKAVVSLKRLAPFADREHSVNRRKVQQLRKTVKERTGKSKKTIEENTEPPEAASGDASTSSKKKRKRKGKKAVAKADDEILTEPTADQEVDNDDTTAHDGADSEAAAPSKKKRKHKKKGKKANAPDAATPAASLSASRLESYRLKPLKK
ncbi:hypothetical protein H310_00036 [Aphanomyces invadans]|uniref:Kri1-like C-terminal domain-containing protein n=1 Tax=Aphanomyces invadans TaxID=157072 RepID=A0A024UU53_9STRA|nr:hypothetical protein H310_00036 [Aphanomyces invadans]ETW09432.1 hypothetical protein H310_00036 [Aphanomyces invadans]|eukprot:XP_008860843.1 hypothetical protein H310_00036 [Aphanomyces invadans]